MWTQTASFFCCLGMLLSVVASPAAEPVNFSIDFGRTNGLLRPLHGVNKGPIAAGGTIDLTAQHRALGIPFTRLHDCLWPHPDVVDIHAIFRNPAADPELPASYDFALTDEYLAAVHRTGAKMIYRLGESIEHMNVKRFVHPPADVDQWAAIGAGIIRHYNEGWANGFHYEIPCVEIWNEPENRPAMWSGTDDDFLRLYTAAARRLKKQFPNIKVGGPGFGATGTLQNGVLKPTEFLSNFLKHCRMQRVPLDFLSWHCYTAEVEELAGRAKEIRKLLDAEGFRRTESHLNEWNYLPDNSWEPFGKSASAATRREFYTRAQGAEGASFALAALIRLQDASVDVANFFHGEIGGFGLFDEFGGETHVFRAFKEFNAVLSGAPIRVQATREKASGTTMVASRSQEGTVAALLFSNPTVEPRTLRVSVANLPAQGQGRPALKLISGRGHLDPPPESAPMQMILQLGGYSCGVIRFVPEK